MIDTQMPFRSKKKGSRAHLDTLNDRNSGHLDLTLCDCDCCHIDKKIFAIGYQYMVSSVSNCFQPVKWSPHCQMDFTSVSNMDASSQLLNFDK